MTTAVAATVTAMVATAVAVAAESDSEGDSDSGVGNGREVPPRGTFKGRFLPLLEIRKRKSDEIDDGGENTSS